MEVFMKNRIKLFGIIALAAILLLGTILVSCGDGAGGGIEGGGGSSMPFSASDGAANIGRTGPGGGKIGYYSSAGFTVAGLGTCHYLEVSPANLTGGTGGQESMKNTTATSNTGYSPIIGTSTSIGSGKNNTTIIIASENILYSGNSYVYAAKACANYNGGGKNDWFLPSKDELNYIYQNLVKGKSGHGFTVGASTSGYWSSSLWNNGVDNWYFWCQYFYDGDPGTLMRTVNCRVRAVRAF